MLRYSGNKKTFLRDSSYFDMLTTYHAIGYTPLLRYHLCFVQRHRHKTDTLIHFKGNILITILCVNEILTPKCKVWCWCLSSGVNCIYYGLKSCILVKDDDLWITGRSARLFHPQVNGFHFGIELKIAIWIVVSKSVNEPSEDLTPWIIKDIVLS